jgi:hypothetical protein
MNRRELLLAAWAAPPAAVFCAHARARGLPALWAPAFAGANEAESDPSKNNKTLARTFRVGDDEVVLADVILPDDFAVKTPSPTVQAAGEFVVAALQGNAVAEDVFERDRWGRRVVIVRGEDGLSLQEQLIEQGLARVRPQSDRTDFIAALLAREAQARKARRGVWRERYYRVRDALDAEDAVGGFHLVEGVVAAVKPTKSRTYLNFGPDWRSDFTATLPPRVARKWTKENADATLLAGKRLRVRGYVAWINGPSIEVAHLQQIEIL